MGLLPRSVRSPTQQRAEQVIAAMAAIGAGEALAQPALSGLIAEIVPTPRLQSANSLRGMLGSVAVLCGPALAGAALVLGGPGAAVAFDTASYGASPPCSCEACVRRAGPG